MKEPEALERKLEQLTAEAPLTIDSVDWTISNPALLDKELGRTFRNFQRVEQEVNDEVLEALLPNLSEQKQFFISVWKQQENPHGNLFSVLRTLLGHEHEDFSDVKVPFTNHFAGTMGKISSGLHESFEMIYLARGAMHERLTKQGYELMSGRLTKLGEVALRDTLVAPILRQEAHHLGYYRMAAAQLKTRLQPWQKYVVRKLSLMSYAPVGAGNNKDKPEFGHSALTLVAGTPNAKESKYLETYGWDPKLLAKRRLQEFSSPIQRIGQQLLSLSDTDVLPNIVYKGIMDCVEAEYAVQAA